MTDEQLNIICAEAEGWTLRPYGDRYVWYTPDGIAYPTDMNPAHYVLPDYGTDLNAMHKMEKVLKYEPDYILHLVQLLDVPDGRGDWDDEELWASVVMATAAQRREAFVRTIGKWEEE